jgi:glycosyltransferase involved in cell wall biosynthesis
MISQLFDAQSYARIIDQLIADPALAEKIGSEGRAVAAREFDYTLYGPRIKQFIASLAPRAQI